MNNAKEFFIKEWGTGFHDAELKSDKGLLKMAMTDIYETMDKYAQQQVKNTVDLADVSKCDNPHCEDGLVGEVYGEKMYCSKCEDK